jgi:tetratricopeptide (TPR) repeat protein
MKIRLISTIWGDRFTDLFLRITVRSLLARDNVPAVATRHRASWTIYTTEESRETCRRSPIFRRLEGLLRTEFAIFAPGEIDARNPSSHWIAWHRGAELARENGELAFFIIADLLYAASTLSRWAERFEEGYRAVWAQAQQVVAETAIEEIERQFSPDTGEPIVLSGEEVARLTVRHLHPVRIGMFRDSRRWTRHPEVVFAGVPGVGIAMRAIGSHPFCVDPSYFPMTDAFSPLDHLEAIAFEGSCGVGLEPMLKTPNLYYRIAAMDEDRLSSMGAWLDYFMSPADVIESQRTHRFAVRESGDDAPFARADEALGFYVCQVRLTGAIYRAVREIRRAKCRLAAGLVATAHFTGRLRRHWNIRGAVTVLVPDDAAIHKLGREWFDGLVAPGNEKALIDAVLSHVLPGRHHFVVGEPLSFEVLAAAHPTSRARPRVRLSARVVSGPIQVDDCTIYVVDRPLLTAAPVSRASGGSRPPGRWAAHPARVTTSSPAPGAVDAPEPVGQTVRALLLRARPRALDALRRGYWTLASLPGGRRPADAVRAVVRRLVVDPIDRRLALAERQDIATIVRSSSRATVAATRAGDPSEPSIEAFGDIQSARVLLVLAELMRFYRRKVDECFADYPPLQVVERCIRETGISEERLAAELEEVVRRAPGFAEAWYELGDVHLVRKEYAEALACFDRCLSGTFSIAVPPGHSGYDALAAQARAMVLEARGEDLAAVDTYRRAIGLDASAGMVHVAHGRLLRRLGRGREACAAFDAAMDGDRSAPWLERVPRDLATMARRLVARFGSSGAPPCPTAAGRYDEASPRTREAR